MMSMMNMMSLINDDWVMMMNMMCDDDASGVEMMAGMTEWWPWSRREEEENATGLTFSYDSLA